MSPAQAAKVALKAAIRAAGRKGSDLSNMDEAELKAIAHTLNIDGEGVARVARANALATRGRLPVETITILDDTEDSTEDLDTPDPDPIEATVSAGVARVRDIIMREGFSALDGYIADLIREANKPPVTVEVERVVTVEVDRATGATHTPAPKAPTIVSHVTNAQKTWRELFGVRGALGKRTCTLWDGKHPDCPRVNPHYEFPQAQTAMALVNIEGRDNNFLFGPPGTGKTEWTIQLAARLGRPHVLISCDNSTDAAELLGRDLPVVGGGTEWFDGALTKAIRIPGAVICIDEPSAARPGALFVMHNMLANRYLTIAATGERVKVAPGVIFIACDNTNGTGGGGRQGFVDTNTMNAAFMNRFVARIRFTYMAEDDEIALLCKVTGCPEALASILVKAANVTRAAAAGETITMGIGLRTLFGWAKMLTAGLDPEAVFRAAVLDAVPARDVEAMRQQCMLAYDKAGIARALAPVTVDDGIMLGQPDMSQDNPTPAGRAAAGEFDAV